MEDSSDERGLRQIIRRAIDTALIPVQAATSKSAQRAYLGTLLFTTTSIFLLCISSVAYALFYYNYIPQIGVERVIHLQFGDGHPHGSADLSSTLTSLQAYDVSLFLHLPRTPSNLAAGNFMLDVSLLAPTKSSSSSTTSPLVSTSTTPNPSTTVAHSRRPAILTYVSPLVSTASTLSGIPFYVLGWKRESEVLEVPIFEGVSFAKGWSNIPRYAHVSVEADEKMQFYDVGLRFVARFRGLRWVIYHHWIVSYVGFTMAFWTSSMVSCAVAWVGISRFWAAGVKDEEDDDDAKKKKVEVKKEAEEEGELDPTSMEDLSDTSRTFPTLGRQMPLHFSGRRDWVKQEDEEKMRQETVVASTSIQPLGAEADDEGDEEEAIASWRDSGIGTSLEDADRRRSVQRRRRALFGGDK
ncbi:MAG: hypothetical protein Q9191_005506 [Dirinaria sp. TL-2023a]